MLRSNALVVLCRKLMQLRQGLFAELVAAKSYLNPKTPKPSALRHFKRKNTVQNPNQKSPKGLNTELLKTLNFE